ncbi:hypothetical protein SAMN05192569_10902 [Parageobacillus thermantarcticus]|uniref:Uncharacterized protein n=1 Tax=Parageobacillus thermantarcticus TaxID=186116 RepID=A0A1I0U227_9BACL|nr:hypothetical protein SAMN05192569_10902 [Parageobacillus thermantarcticus]
MNRLFLQAIPFCNILYIFLYIFLIILGSRETLDKSTFLAFKPYIFGAKAYIFGVQTVHFWFQSVHHLQRCTFSFCGLNVK